MNSNAEWVDDLFLILDIPATKAQWQKKFNETLNSLKTEVQFVISTLNNNEQQLIQEAQKRVTSFYINGCRSNLTIPLKVSASEILLRNQQPELALTVLQPLDMVAGSSYLINFGRALMQMGILDQARHCFISAAETDPDSPEPLFHLAFQAGLSGDIDAASRLYAKSLENDENHIGSLLNLAYLNYQLEQFEEAIEYGKKVIQLDASHVGGYLSIIACYNAMRKFDESRHFITKARSNCAVPVLELDELEAVVCFEQGQYEQAVELVSHYLAARPESVDLRYIRGRASIKLENWSLALTDIDALLSLEPFDTETLEMRFNVLFWSKQWSEAELAYIKLTENAPDMRMKYQQELSELRKNLAMVIG